MIKTLRNIGDSLGITLPTRELRALGLGHGTPCTVIIEDGIIQLIPLERAPQVAEVGRKVSSLIKRYSQTLELLYEK